MMCQKYEKKMISKNFERQLKTKSALRDSQ